jgi:hypothetical protein
VGLRFGGPIRRDGGGARVARHAAAARGAWVNLLISADHQTAPAYASPRFVAIMLDAEAGIARSPGRRPLRRRTQTGLGLVVLLAIVWGGRAC